MIHIRRSEYERLLSQEAKLIKIEELVQQLREEIALLKNGRNSKTSSMAPSQDINRSNNAHSLRERSGKKTGGQPGHPGHTLSMSETLDQVIDHIPARCTCECSLGKVVKLNNEPDNLLIVDVSGFHQKGQAFINRFLKNRQSIFIFRNAEGKGAERFARLRSIIDTTVKNGQDVFFAIFVIVVLFCISCSENTRIMNSRAVSFQWDIDNEQLVQDIYVLK